MTKKMIVGRILGHVPHGDAGEIVVEDVDSDGDIYTVKRMSQLRIIERIEDGRSGGYGGQLLYEFEVNTTEDK